MTKHQPERSMGRLLRDGPKGQSLVEFALILPILIMIMSGILDFGRIYYIYVALEDCTSEGASFLTIMPNCVDASDCANPNNAAYRVEHATDGILNWANANIVELSISDSDNDGVSEYGDNIVVRVSYDIQLLTPIIPVIAGVNPLTITTQSAQIVAPLLE